MIIERKNSCNLVFFPCSCIDFTMCPYLDSYLTVKLKGTSKGQLTSKCLFGRFDQNSKEIIVKISALKVFIALFGLPVGFLINYITYLISPQEAQKASRKPQKASRKPPGSYKKFQGRNPHNIFVAILVKTMTL